MSWSPIDCTKLAVSSSDNNIYILHDDGDGFKKIGELVGHQSSVTSVCWSSQSEQKLVSASFDHTVRVWDAQTMECIAWSEYENKMQCAAFLPTGMGYLRYRILITAMSKNWHLFAIVCLFVFCVLADENFIVCSGISETMHIFEIQKRLVASIGKCENKKKKKSLSTEVQWATLYQNEASKLRTQEKKKLRKLEKKASDHHADDELSSSLNAIQLNSASQQLKVNPKSI